MPCIRRSRRREARSRWWRSTASERGGRVRDGGARGRGGGREAPRRAHVGGGGGLPLQLSWSNWRGAQRVHACGVSAVRRDVGERWDDRVCVARRAVFVPDG